MAQKKGRATRSGDHQCIRRYAANDLAGEMIDWHVIERITQGRLGRTMATCPLCSDKRSNAQNRRSKVLAVNLIEPEFAVYFCNHCRANGYCRPDTPSRLIDLAEQRRRREEAQRYALAEQQRRTESALSIWNEGVDPAGTAAETYLRARKLALPFELRVTVLRFHPAFPWEGGRVPCLIAAFRSVADNALTGIHRVRLDRPERWPKTERMMLACIAGSAVKFDSPGDSLVVGEGIETCLAARQLNMRPAWAVGSANGIRNLRPVESVRDLYILGENDGGINRQAAIECSEAWAREAKKIFYVKPRRGKDINDALMERENVA
jgi:putative DNA primase/helicase